MYTCKRFQNLGPLTNTLKDLFFPLKTVLSVVALQKPPKPTTPLRGAAKSFLDYRLSPLKSTLYETCIQININRRIYIGRGEKVYMHKSHMHLSSI